MQGVTVPANEKKEYFCGRCKSEWTQMEVLDNVGPNGFLCHRCGFVLTHDGERQSGSHQKSTRMNNQFKFITEQLQKIDAVHIPDNPFDNAFEKRRPVVRDAMHQVSHSIGVDINHRPTAVKGLANTGPTKIAVEFSGSNGPSEEEKAAEAARKEKVAQQNALPSWMSNSTVTGEAFRLNDAAAGAGKAADAVKDPTAKAVTDAKQVAAIDDLFAKLDQRKAEEESSEEDDDEEFEDVIATPGTGSGGGNPASPAAGLGVGTAPVVPSPLRQSSIKREASNGYSSGGNSPGGSDGRPVKKVKVEEPPPQDDESDDDIEFEDVS
jgi:transcription initiation factor TFIIE subunit alpha